MRIITGSARGRRLAAPEGYDVRPTTERVKEGIFSAIQFDIEGRRVLDLFAGSGQLGLEALSRGAESAVFVDSSPVSSKIIQKNIDATGFQDKATVFGRDYAAFLSTSKGEFDIAFLDPPYNENILIPALSGTASLMSDYGVIICEHPPEIALPEAVSGFKISRSYRYAKITVTMYRKEVSVGE